MDLQLEKIRAFADEAHGDQRRKFSPDRYIVHPVRVMEMCRSYTDSVPVLAAALLHDVLEDTPVTGPQLHQFLVTVMSTNEAGETLHLVEELTDIFTKEAHPQWNREKRKRMESGRIEKTSADSQTIKYADIIDNCHGIVQGDPDFAKVFLHECKDLLGVLKKGNRSLFEKAVETVNHYLQMADRT